MWVRRGFRPRARLALASADGDFRGESVIELNEQQMRALEMRAEGLRHLTTVALTLAGVLGTVAGTVLKDMEPAKVIIAAGCFLLTALAALMGSEIILKAMETGVDMRRQIRFPTVLAQVFFGMGWAVLVYQGVLLLT